MKRIKKNSSTPVGYDLDQGVTQSMLCNFIKCRRAAALALNRWGSPAPRRATQFGSLFHELLQEHYRGAGKKLPPSPELTFKNVAQSWERKALEAGDKTEDIQGDLACAKALFPSYVDRWRKNDEKKRWVEVEQVFDFMFRHGHKRFQQRIRGKIDGIYEAKDGTIWILETKTASQINEETLSLALTFDFQCQFYVVAVEEKLQRKVSGILYNIIRKPSIGRGADKTSDAYVQLIKNDIASRPDFYFTRFELAFSSKQMARFRDELSLKLQDFQNWWLGDLPTYRNEFACQAKWNCEYLPVCACGGDPKQAGFKQSKTLFSELLEDA